MIRLRLIIVTLLLSIGLGSSLFAGKKNCQSCKRVQFAEQPMQSGSQYKQPTPVQSTSQEQADIQKAQAASLQMHQEQQQAQDIEEACAIEESLTTVQNVEQSTLDEALMQHALANSITNLDNADTSFPKIGKEIPKSHNRIMVDSVKNWFVTRWHNTKLYAGLAKDYVAENTSKAWAKTKGGCKHGWTKSKQAFQKLVAKITPKKKATA